jgi:hypothetical protein
MIIPDPGPDPGTIPSRIQQQNVNYLTFFVAISFTKILKKVEPIDIRVS